MISFAETFGATILSFIVPAFAGLLVISAVAKRLKGIYLAAFGVGIYLWFFSDTISDAAYLSVDSGFTGGAWHFLVWLVFGIGLVTLFGSDRSLFSKSSEAASSSLMVPILLAIAIGIHGFGEGAAIGATAATAPGGDLLDAFGGASAGLAFVLHKALEPVMVGVAYWVYARDRAKGFSATIKDISLLAVVFSLPGIVGSAVAYYLVQVYPNADFSYVFALGLGTSIYALARLTRPLFTAEGTSGSDSLKVGLMLLLGFTCLYLAALLHS